MKRRIDAYEILDLINPQIKNPGVFLRFFSTMMTPILNNLKNFINEKIRNGVQEGWSEQQKIDYRNVVMMYRNFLVLMNIEKIFGGMRNEDAKGFDPEKLKKSEGGNLGKMIEKLII